MQLEWQTLSLPRSQSNYSHLSCRSAFLRCSSIISSTDFLLRYLLIAICCTHLTIALIAQYRGLIQGLLGQLNTERLARAVEIARVPEDIRGFGPIKHQAMDAAQTRWAGLLRDWLREEIARTAA